MATTTTPRYKLTIPKKKKKKKKKSKANPSNNHNSYLKIKIKTHTHTTNSPSHQVVACHHNCHKRNPLGQPKPKSTISIELGFDQERKRDSDRVKRKLTATHEPTTPLTCHRYTYSIHESTTPQTHLLIFIVCL